MFPLKMKNNKVLILGAQGNLGGVIMREFGNEYQLFCWDRDELDVTDRGAVMDKICAIRPNIIINTVAYNAVDKCEDDAAEFEIAKKVNGAAVGYIADAAMELGATLIHYSTDYVFGGGGVDIEQAKKAKGFSEGSTPMPINKYGETKLMGEQEVLARASEGLKYYIIRLSKLFGPKGSSPAAKPAFFDVMKDLAETRDSLDVVDEEISCFTYSRDLARATREIIEEGKEHGIYHVVNEGSCTWYEGVVEMFKILKKDININPVAGDKFPRPAKRPPFSVLKNTKIKKMRNYKDALSEYLKN